MLSTQEGPMKAMRWTRCGLVLAVGAIALGAGVPPKDQRPENIVIAVTADGTILWDGKPVTCEELNARFQRATNHAKPGTHVPRIHCEMPPWADPTTPHAKSK
jgi:hypothetical protein